MQAFKFGDANLFVKGIVEVQIFDPVTGNIIGYDKVARDGSITSSVNMSEITGGIGNPVLLAVPDTTRLSGTLTSQAFSLRQRALASGSNITYDGIAPVSEEITATGTTLTVTNTPAKYYGQLPSDTTAWCYVREKGAASYLGVNYGVDITTKQVQGFTATSGKTYQVFYFTNASAETLTLSSNFIPDIATLQYKFNVYAKQGGSVNNGTLHGVLYFVVPRAQFGGDVGISANQTDNATTSYDWTALAETDNMPAASSCINNSSPYAYYIYVPCQGTKALVEALTVIGGAVAVSATSGAANHTKQIPVKYVMPDGSLAQPTYADLEFTSEAVGTATVNDDGVVTGVATGDTEITITLQKPDNTTLTTYCNVSVTA